MKKTFLLLGLAVALFTACSDDETKEILVDKDANVVEVKFNIKENTTWYSDSIYQLGGRIAVEAGATLTIQPGTIIKGELGEGTNASALLVARDAKINAVGTADAPIIFTSELDEIQPEDVAAGEFASPNLTSTQSGLWGGVIILGNGVISAANENDEDVSEAQIEGIPTSDSNGLYGGSDNADDSGKFQYISIRHGGSNIGAGNEINGLTLGGVGSTTKISNIEIVANEDDGIEWFGGAVELTNVVVWNVNDDGIDTDQAWDGSIDNFVVITPAGSCFELDGPEGSIDPATAPRHTIKNGLAIAKNDDRTIGGHLIDVDTSTPVDMMNVNFIAPLIVDGAAIANVTDDEVVVATFDNVYFDVDAANLSMLMKTGTIPTGIAAGTTSTVDTSVLSWTWAAKASAF